MLTQHQVVHAQRSDESLRIHSEIIDDYEVIVGVRPHKPTIGVVYISVSPIYTRDQTPINDAKVMIVAHKPDGTPTYQSPAIQNPAKPQFYVGNINFRSAGIWHLEIDIETPEGSSLSTTTPLNIQEMGYNSGPAGTILLLIIVASICLVTTYLWISSKKNRKAAKEHRS